MEKGRLARRIRAFRKLKGLTQTELAEQINVSVGILGAIERGNRIPDVKIVTRIAQTLNIELTELMEPNEK